MNDENDIFVRLCPVCGSTKLKWLSKGIRGESYECQRCGYIGVILEGNKKFIKKFKENNKKF